jgi:hypothetical protein
LTIKALFPLPSLSIPSYPDGTLLADTNPITLYLMEGGQKRRIIDPASYDFSGETIIDISINELDLTHLIPSGLDI